MTTKEETAYNKAATMETSEIREILALAAEKIQATKENDVCRYLSRDADNLDEGYFHHFSVQKMVRENPKKLASLLHKYILSPKNPKEVPPRQRAARGSKKASGIPFTKSDISRMVQILRTEGQHDLIRKLIPVDLKGVKRQLMQSIKNGEVQQALWDAYCELIQALERNPVSPGDFQNDLSSF